MGKGLKTKRTSWKEFPKRFLAWGVAKTVIQLTLSFFSLQFILASNFFIPGQYDPTVWSREMVRALYMPQALFEVGDLVAELYMVNVESNKAHLPWQSIAHHLVSAGYGFFVYYSSYDAEMEYLGLAVAAISCQVIGFLYTMFRLKLRFKKIGLALLVVQLGYRMPLAIVSCIRAVQFFDICPWPHFFICGVLAYLDVNWTQWSYGLYKRSLIPPGAASKKNSDVKSMKSKTSSGPTTSEPVGVPAKKEELAARKTFPNPAQFAAQHLKAL